MAAGHAVAPPRGSPHERLFVRACSESLGLRAAHASRREQHTQPAETGDSNFELTDLAGCFRDRRYGQLQHQPRPALLRGGERFRTQTTHHVFDSPRSGGRRSETPEHSEQYSPVNFTAAAGCSEKPVEVAYRNSCSASYEKNGRSEHDLYLEAA
jgi:hypothetical protein